MGPRSVLPSLAALALLVPAGPGARAAGRDTGLHLEPRPPQLEELPRRPRPLVELGEPFLATGKLGRGNHQIHPATGATCK